MQVRVTDGVWTETLSGGVSGGGAWDGVTYFPTPGEEGQEASGETGIAETAEARLWGTVEDVRGAVNGVERLFGEARRRQAEGAGPRVYVEYQAREGEAWYRSEVLDGRVRWSENPALRRLGGATARAQVGVMWRRRGFWEGPEQALAWDGGAGSVSVSNGDTGTRYNRATIQGVEGTLPAPVRLQLVNNSGVGVAWRRFTIANDYQVGLTGLQHMLQYVGGPASWSVGIEHSTLLFILPLAGAVVGKCAGRWMRLMGAFAAAASPNVFLRAGVWAQIGMGYFPLAIGNEVSNSVEGSARRLVDLGSVPIPPGGAESATGNLAVIVTARCVGGGNLTLDFVQVTPAEGLRRLEQVGYTTGAGDGVVDDGMEGAVYYQSSAGVRSNIVRGVGGPLVVWPGRVNRILTLFDEGGGYTPGRSLVVSGAYRPRRATV